jgi:hypothetical protein
MSKLRTTIVGVVAVAIVSVATVVILEGAASLVLFAKDYRSATAPSSVIRPQTSRDTLLGWVNRKTPTVDSTARAHVLCAGDSYTAGDGVDEAHSWCALLQRRYPGVQTINVAEGAYGLDQMYLWYKRDGVRIPHDVQILAVTDGVLNRASTEELNGRHKPSVTLEGGRLVTHNVPVRPQTAADLNHEYAERTFNELRVVQLFKSDDARDANARVQNHWPAYEAMLDDLAATHRARGSRLVVVYLPIFREARAGTNDDRRKRLAEFAQGHNISFVDLTPALRTLRRDSLDLVYTSRILRNVPSSVVGLYSDLGHAWVAAQLAPHLDSLSVLTAGGVSARREARAPTKK